MVVDGLRSRFRGDRDQIMTLIRNLVDIVNAQKSMWFAVLQPVGALIFMVTTLAEVNRAPFDMPEAEQELAAGYHSEYSGMKFALFFMAEYEKMIVISMIAATLYFGGYREFWFLQNTFLSVDQNWWLGPFYLLASGFAALSIGLWGLQYAGWLPAPYLHGPRKEKNRLQCISRRRAGLCMAFSGVKALTASYFRTEPSTTLPVGPRWQLLSQRTACLHSLLKRSSPLIFLRPDPFFARNTG